MCVIIIKQKGKQLSPEIAKTSGRMNPHGLGIIWLDTFEISYHNSNEYKKLLTDRPYIAHFRYATIGAVGRNNTHPFQCGANKHEYLMMNGTIRELGNAKDCDSKVLARQLGNKPRHTWASELEKHTSRFVTINVRNRTYQMYNKHLWTKHSGIWFSKDDVIEDNLIAVYGTLRKGNGNYNYYLADSKHLGKGYTKEKYPLIIEGLPYLIDKKGVGHNVEVDVFKVSNSVMQQLDTLEGHPTWYRRKQVLINVGNKEMLCWVYFNNTISEKGKTMHVRYEKPKTTTIGKVSSSRLSLDYPLTKYGYQSRFYFEDAYEPLIDDFDVKNEKPLCKYCYHDLEHDYFNNYHCNYCDAWFNEYDVIKKFV